jgi:two-component system NtrC family sensor kinase
MKCARCQQENQSFARFCLQCGTPLKSIAFTPESDAAVRGEVESLRQALRESHEQQIAAAEVLKVISRSTLDLQPVLGTVAENAVRLCGAEMAFIFRFDGELLRAAASHNAPPELRAFVEANPIRPGRHTVTARTALERRTVHIHDVRTDPEYTYGAKEVDPIRTVLGIPMLRGDDLLGVIIIFRHEVRPFTDRQIALLQTFADQAVIAIENVRLFTELQEKNRALTAAHAQVTEALEQQMATSEILRVISQSPTNVQPVFDTIAERAVKLCDGEIGVVSIINGEYLQLVAMHGLAAERAEATRRAFPMPSAWLRICRVLRTELGWSFWHPSCVSA